MDIKRYQSKTKKKNLTNIDIDETLTKKQHRLLVEGYLSDELLKIYDDLNDLELADLSDYFALERRDGGTKL